MKKLLIIKTGATYAAIRQKHGDFDDFIMNQAGLSPDDVFVSSVYKNESLPKLRDISAIIITGSHAMVSDFDDWSVYLSEWLRDVVQKSIPVLGICYGHQLIAQALGGNVGYHPGGREIGTVKIELTDNGKKDPLLGVLPHNFSGHVMHSQTVMTLPANARVLAKNDFEKHHAFVLYDTIWSVQFHPEFNADITHQYIEEQKTTLLNEGYNIEVFHESVQENDLGKLLLKRFIHLIV